jgi:PKD repeat protein
MKKDYNSKFTFILLWLPIFSLAQGIKECATELTALELAQHRSQLVSMRYDCSKHRPDNPFPIKTVAVTLHIVSKTDGTGAISLNDIMGQFKRSNALFKDAGIEFYICGTLYHTGDDLYALKDFSEMAMKYAPLDKANTANVWFIGDAAGTCGIASLPASDSGPGRVVLSNICVSNGTSMEHEFGHYFGLPHTHDGGGELVARPGTGKTTNCDKNGDGFCDTPADPSLGGVTVNANTCLITSSMSKDSNGDTYVPDPQNIMSYSSQKSCRTIFSQEQLNFMNYNVTTHSNRKNLKCTDTTIAKTDFYVKSNSGCKGEIQFYDKTTGTQPFAFKWSFPGGIPLSSTEENPVVMYPADGNYDVTLSVKTAYGSDVITKSITVKAFKPVTIPYFQDFSDIVAVFETIDSLEGAQSDVLIAAAGGKTNNGLVLTGVDALNAYFSKAPKVNAFKANPAFNSAAGLYCVDLTNVKDGKLTFDYKLLFAVSAFFTSFGVYINDELVKFYSPASESDEIWKTDIIDLKPYAGRVIDIVFKGCSRNAYNNVTSANGTFVDNINITGTTTTDISESASLDHCNLYPNPTSGVFALQGAQGEQIKVEVYDVTGLMVYTGKSFDGTLHVVDLSDLGRGLYTVKVVFSNSVETKKLIIE